LDVPLQCLYCGTDLARILAIASAKPAFDSASLSLSLSSKNNNQSFKDTKWIDFHSLGWFG
jgi:hypothetical protein